MLVNTHMAGPFINFDLQFGVYSTLYIYFGAITDVSALSGLDHRSQYEIYQLKKQVNSMV